MNILVAIILSILTYWLVQLVAPSALAIICAVVVLLVSLGGIHTGRW